MLLGALSVKAWDY
jgi:hypothetical protein